jgi:hypothetical protein
MAITIIINGIDVIDVDCNNRQMHRKGGGTEGFVLLAISVFFELFFGIFPAF